MTLVVSTYLLRRVKVIALIREKTQTEILVEALERYVKSENCGSRSNRTISVLLKRRRETCFHESDNSLGSC